MQQKLLKLLLMKPDLYLDEMQWFLAEECDIYVDITTISRHLDEADWTNKRVYLVAAQRNEELRRFHLFKISYAEARAEQFVFVDECGTDKRDGARRTGWAPKGYTPRVESGMTRGKHFHIMPAITIHGLLEMLVWQGQSTKEGFIAWLRDKIIPQMNPFPGPNSILVMDNASWHHDKRIVTMGKEGGIWLLYLPPYSPDFNPIEAYFGDLKQYIRRHYQYLAGDFVSDLAFAQFLQGCAYKVAENLEAIEGHFRHARVPFSEEPWVEPTEFYIPDDIPNNR